MASIEIFGSDAFLYNRQIGWKDETDALSDRQAELYKAILIIQELLAGYSPISPIGYSNTEQALPGVTWIDGSQVYQITVTGNTGTVLNTYTNLPFQIPNIGTLIQITGSVVNNAGSYVPIQHLTRIAFCLSATGVLQESHDMATFSNVPFSVTVLYTKR